MNKDFDAIVIGVGGMGSAALYHLARRGLSVLGIEQFGIAHDHGSSHGQTRIIRKAYFEHPAYVPLLHRAYELWGELERVTKRELFCRCGLLLGGPADGEIVRGVQRAAFEHQLDIRTLTNNETVERFPGLRIPPSDVILFEPDAGFLAVEACVQAHADAARACSANILSNTAVESWSAHGDGVSVRTADAEYTARSLVISGGAWAGRLLHEVGLPLEVRRKVVFWYEAADDSYDVKSNFPVFGFQTRGEFLYGFPRIDESGVKVANHSGGNVVEDPAALDCELHPEDEESVSAFIHEYLTRLTMKRVKHSVCMYTMTPDEHFIIDRHPGHPNVVFVAGLSGHGFKFAPIIGSILADLATEGRTSEPIDFLSARRFGL